MKRYLRRYLDRTSGGNVFCLLLVMGAGGLIVFGSLNPWWSALVDEVGDTISLNGVQGNSEGWVTLICGALAAAIAVAALVRPSRVAFAIAAALFLLGAGIAVYNVSFLPTVSSAYIVVFAADKMPAASHKWGLWLCLIASLAGLTVCVPQVVRKWPQSSLTA